jgi:hypothetical protein
MVYGRYTHIDKAIIASTIHIAHANVIVQEPHIGTQTKMNISIMVVNPIGIVPKNNDWLG